MANPGTVVLTKLNEMGSTLDSLFVNLKLVKDKTIIVLDANVTETFEADIKAIFEQLDSILSTSSIALTSLYTDINSVKEEAGLDLDRAKRYVKDFVYKINKKAMVDFDKLEKLVLGYITKANKQAGGDSDKFSKYMRNYLSKIERDLKLFIDKLEKQADTDFTKLEKLIKTDFDKAGVPEPGAPEPDPDQGPETPTYPEQPDVPVVIENDWEALLTNGNRVGFGRNTTGGLGHDLYRVTNLNDSGPGSLRAGAEAGMKWIVFDVSGTIRLNNPIRVGSNITVDCRARNITIENSGLDIVNRDNVILHGLTVQNASDDAVKVYKSTNVWLDHLTLENTTDGLLDITEQSHYVTVSWCHLRNQNKTMLIGANNSRTADVIISVTVHHCHFENTIRRNPYLRFGRGHFFNNLFDNWGEGNGGDCVNSTSGGQILLENNVFIAGANNRATRNTIPGYNGSEGYINAIGNMSINGAIILNFNPEFVFDAADLYDYVVETADDALIQKIKG